jgi:hypothetical protein
MGLTWRNGIVGELVLKEKRAARQTENAEVHELKAGKTFRRTRKHLREAEKARQRAERVS